MDRTITHGITTQQRRALDFMLDELGLRHFGEEAYRTARLLELEQRLPALFHENHSLRQRIAELEYALAPDETELDALGREVYRRVARVRGCAADDI